MYRASLLLSRSALAVLMVFANFTDITRAPSSPGLREWNAIPLVFLQLVAVVWLLTQPTEGAARARGRAVLLTVGSTIACLLSWQLCGNLFLLQLLALLGVHTAGHLDAPGLRRVLLCHGAALAVAVALLFGNLMLAVSWYSCLLLTMLATGGLLGCGRCAVRV